MSPQSPTYALHPEAFDDIDEIREYIAEGSPDAADRMVTEIFDSIRALVPFPQQGYRRPTSHRARFGSNWCAITWLPMARTKNVVGCGGISWTPQPPRDSCDPERKRVKPRCFQKRREAPPKGLADA